MRVVARRVSDRAPLVEFKCPQCGHIKRQWKVARNVEYKRNFRQDSEEFCRVRAFPIKVAEILGGMCAKCLVARSAG